RCSARRDGGWTALRSAARGVPGGLQGVSGEDCGVAGVGGWLMKALVGAVVLLAGAVWFAGGAVAEAILAAAQRSGYSGGGIIGMLVGAPVVLAGLILLGIGWKFDSAAR